MKMAKPDATRRGVPGVQASASGRLDGIAGCHATVEIIERHALAPSGVNNQPSAAQFSTTVAQKTARNGFFLVLCRKRF